MPGKVCEVQCADLDEIPSDEWYCENYTNEKTTKHVV